MGTSLAPGSHRLVVEQPGLRARVAALRDEHLRLWAATPSAMPTLGPPVGWRRHLSNEWAARRLVDVLAAEIEQVPDGECERQAWRESVRERLQAFGEERLAWPAGYRRLLFADAFLAASLAFAREARAFDPDLPLESLGQALRNVWIGNSLQMRLGLPVELGPGLFAYSMLYPLTDNLLDDPALDGQAKRVFNERFGRRLAGLHVRAERRSEVAVFELVGRIEEEFPRGAFPAVHESLLAIHRGQARSLGQQATRPGVTRRSSRSASRRGAAPCWPTPTWWPATSGRMTSDSRSATARSCSCSTTCRTSRPTSGPGTARSSPAPRAGECWTGPRRASRGSSNGSSTPSP
jgi:hypothetical protein